MNINSFYPIVPGRVSDPLNRVRSLHQLQFDQGSMQRLQQQLATGRTLDRPSENPRTAAAALSLQRVQADADQHLKNLQDGGAYLRSSEASLAEAGDLINEIYGLSVQANTTTITQAERDQIVQQLDQQLSNLVSIANRTYNGRYLFAGSDVRQTPYSRDSYSVQFHGNTLPVPSIVTEATIADHSFNGPVVFGGSAALISGKPLDVDAIAGSLLSSLNGGTGVPPGAIQFSDGSTQVIVDLSTAKSLEDVTRLISGIDVGGRQLTASVSSGQLSIDYLDAAGGTLRVGEVGTGTTASALGVLSNDSTSPAPVIGGPLSPRIEPLTRLSQLAGGGLDLAAGFRITGGGQAIDIDTSAAQTVQDLLGQINSQQSFVRAAISGDGRGIELHPAALGIDVCIEETTGTLAGQLGLRTLSLQTPLTELQGGAGLGLNANGADLRLTKTDGGVFEVDLGSATTLADVINAINNHPDNQDPTTAIAAAMHSSENRLTLSAAVSSDPSAVPISLETVGGSAAAQQLGLVPREGSSVTAALDTSGNWHIAGSDPNPLHADSVFDAVVRLRNAIRDSDTSAIGLQSEAIGRSNDRVTLSRAAIGLRLRENDRLIDANEDRSIQMAEDLSRLVDTDYAQAITELNALQVSYQASLRLLADLHGQTLFDLL